MRDIAFVCCVAVEVVFNKLRCFLLLFFFFFLNDPPPPEFPPLPPPAPLPFLGDDARVAVPPLGRLGRIAAALDAHRPWPDEGEPLAADLGDQFLLTPRVRLLGTRLGQAVGDRKSTRLNSSHANISYAVFCLKK